MPPTTTSKLISAIPAKNDPKKGSSLAPNKRDPIESSIKEAALGCAILSAFENGDRGTAKLRRISKVDVLRVVENIRQKPVTKDRGHELITVDIKISAEKRIRVSLALHIGSADALLKYSRDNANSFSSMLPDICGQVNNVAGKLLKLGGNNILIQSDRITANRHMANIVLKADSILFA
jgi:hypothetical protein